MRRIFTTLGVSLAAVLLVFNFRARDPLPPLDAFAPVDPMPVVTTVPESTTSTTMSARAMALAQRTTTTTTQAPLPTSPGAVAFDGPKVDTRFGPMQVQIIVADGVIEDVVPLYLPNATRTSRQITRRMWPLYRTKTIDGQSADIDFRSGATVTYDAYIESLEEALELAGLS